MIPNNNLSVLPWYTSIDQQNARKWWMYNRVYPLFTPAGYLLPFQVMRDHIGTSGIAPAGDELVETGYRQGEAIQAFNDGTLTLVSVPEVSTIEWFDLDGTLEYLYISNLPAGIQTHGDYITNVVFVDANGDVIDHYNFLSGVAGVSVNIGVQIPVGAVRVYIQYEAEDYIGYAHVYKGAMTNIPEPINSFKIYTKDGALVGDYTPHIKVGMGYKKIGNIDVLVYPGQLPFISSFAEGQYYAVMDDGTNTWYSEIFTVVGDMSRYLKITWWDDEDFVMDAGVIVYTNPAFKNILYLQADIAKPEYRFEDEGVTRDGYFFPVKQISEKHYRFAFFASEYLLDVMRFIRMADYATIENNGQTYNLDTFLITPEWESNGDVAAVEAEFDTATVAKKIGVGFIKQ